MEQGPGRRDPPGALSYAPDPPASSARAHAIPALLGRPAPCCRGRRLRPLIWVSAPRSGRPTASQGPCSCRSGRSPGHGAAPCCLLDGETTGPFAGGESCSCPPAPATPSLYRSCSGGHFPCGPARNTLPRSAGGRAAQVVVRGGGGSRSDPRGQNGDDGHQARGPRRRPRRRGRSSGSPWGG